LGDHSARHIKTIKKHMYSGNKRSHINRNERKLLLQTRKQTRLTVPTGRSGRMNSHPAYISPWKTNYGETSFHISKKINIQFSKENPFSYNNVN
jgi:hypothetical protein